MRRFVMPLLLSSCSAPAPSPPVKPAAVVEPTSAVVKPACASPEHRQFDFWIGDWDVAIRARKSPTSDEWGEAKGRQRIEAILGGCAISENFSADGPKEPWAGKSYSSWQPQLGKWRQTWVDDGGSFLAFTGGVEDGVMTLYGEPRTVKDVSFQMRMVFKNVTADSLLWEWQRSADEWKTATVMMSIDYKRRR
jgi:hypothetical protein